MLRYNGSVFLDKPPLQIWLNALFSILFGLNEFSIRFVSALSGFVMILIIRIYVYRKWGYLPALIAYGSLILNHIFIWRTRTGNIDSLSTLFLFILRLYQSRSQTRSIFCSEHFLDFYILPRRRLCLFRSSFGFCMMSYM